MRRSSFSHDAALKLFLEKGERHEYLNRVGVLADASVIGADCRPSRVDLLGVDAILGVQMLDLSIGEDSACESRVRVYMAIVSSILSVHSDTGIAFQPPTCKQSKVKHGSMICRKICLTWC